MNKLVSNDNIEKMSNQTKELMKNQENLKNVMKQIGPMVDNAKEMMEGLKGFEGFGLKGLDMKSMLNQFGLSNAEQ